MNWEVRTMPSATSYSKPLRPHAWFSPTLFRKNLTRFWPIWALYGAVWFLMLTAPFLSMGGTGRFRYSPSSFYPRGFVVELIPIGAGVSFVFGILAAMAVFSYLYNSRPAGMMHALPIRREGLFLTNYLSGLCFFLFPIAGVALLTVPAQLYAGCGADLTSVFLWACCQALMSLFFYSFAVFCAMFTGHIMALPAFYVILNFLVLALCWLFEAMASLFLFGFPFSGTIVDRPLVSWLTPLLRYCETLRSTGAPDYRLTGLPSVFAYGLAALALAALALLAYRRRHIESAGDVVSVSWVRPIFKYGVAFCSAVALGTFLWSLFFDTDTDSVWTLLLFLLFAGALGYFVAEMLLRKTFRVFRGNWKGAVGFSLALIAAACVLEFDLTGYETRIPAAEQVAQVQVDLMGSVAPYDSFDLPASLTDPAEIAQAVALHSAVVGQKEALESQPRDYSWTTADSPYGAIDVEELSSISFSLRYTLKDGGVLERSYSIPISRELLDDPDSPAARLEALVNAPGVADQAYFSGSYREGDRLISATITAPDREDLFVSTGSLESLLSAVHSDLDAGRLGRRFLLEDMERYKTCYYNDLALTFQRADRPSAYGQSSDPQLISDTYTITISLQTTASDTLAVLKDLGLDAILVTHLQLSAGS